MAAVSISARGLDTLQRAFELAPDMAREEMLASMTEAGLLLEREVKDAMPAVSGLTRASVTSDAWSTPAGVLGVVGSALASAAAVELGSRPHMPPVEAIEMWVRDAKGLSGKEATREAWRVAMGIKHYGTKAQRPFRNTLEKQRNYVGREFEDCCERIARRLAGAAGAGGAA